MKIRNTQRGVHRKDDLKMTAMIDIVFLLLIFFVMTFRVVAPEGDFDVRMPRKAALRERPLMDLPPLVVQLRAAPGGRLAAIQLGERDLADFDELRQEIRQLLGDDAGPGSVTVGAEVELLCDFDLEFEHIIDAMTAVSGYVADDGRSIVKLIEKIKFAQPRG